MDKRFQAELVLLDFGSTLRASDYIRWILHVAACTGSRPSYRNPRTLARHKPLPPGQIGIYSIGLTTFIQQLFWSHFLSPVNGSDPGPVRTERRVMMVNLLTVSL